MKQLGGRLFRGFVDIRGRNCIKSPFFNAHNFTPSLKPPRALRLSIFRQKAKSIHSSKITASLFSCQDFFWRVCLLCDFGAEAITVKASFRKLFFMIESLRAARANKPPPQIESRLSGDGQEARYSRAALLARGQCGFAGCARHFCLIDCIMHGRRFLRQAGQRLGLQGQTAWTARLSRGGRSGLAGVASRSGGPNDQGACLMQDFRIWTVYGQIKPVNARGFVRATSSDKKNND